MNSQHEPVACVHHERAFVSMATLLSIYVHIVKSKSAQTAEKFESPSDKGYTMSVLTDQKGGKKTRGNCEWKTFHLVTQGHAVVRQTKKPF